MDNLKQMEDVIAHAQAKNMLVEERHQVNEQVKGVLSSTVKGLDSDRDAIMLRLDQVESSEELKKALDRTPSMVDIFFTNDLGEPIDLNLGDITPERELQFKKDLLVYLKATQEYNQKIDEEFAKKEEAEKEFNEEMANCIKLISDNFLIHVQQVEDSLKDPNLTDIQRAQGKKRLAAIKTGYTFEYFIELLDKHPGLKDNVKKDFLNELKKAQIVTNYANKTKKATVNPVLGVMFHNDKVSLERNFLTDDEYGIEGLVLFYMVRCFSMSGFEGLNRTMHSSVSLILTKMVKNDISPEFKEEVVTGLRNLAAKLI